MIRGIHHVGLAVGNPTGTSAFLQSVSGWALLAAPGPSSWLLAPNAYLELLPLPNAAEPLYQPVHEAGITHVCVQAPQIEVPYARAAQAGATFHCPPIDLGTGFLYCYLRDPEQRVIELEGVPFAPPELTPWLAHVAIATPQIERLADFYHHIMGGMRLGGRTLGPNPRLDEITALPDVTLKAIWLTGQNTSLELVQFLTPPTRPASSVRPPNLPGYDHIAFEVDDLDAALAGCLAAGARPATTQSPHTAGRTAWVHDPDGNLLELLEWSPGDVDRRIAALPDPSVIARIAALR